LAFSITFYEEGMGFAGRFEFSNGELVSEEDLPIEDFVDYEDYDEDEEDESGDKADSIGGEAV
jgi:hypothetical protein